DRYAELKEAITALDKRDQLILQFYYVEDLGVQEISDILEISVSRVSQLHGRSLAHLREKLKAKRS
ncbi:MAG: sigma-70 family RNA polymerase sigma factor, partial [Turicibacter sp.]